ncbi:MAG: quinoprotein dehydrogenase-associated SoxYZ-like carrier [Hyphomicrobiaceae bacterium]
MIRQFGTALLTTLASFILAIAITLSVPAHADEDWDSIRSDFFGDREILDGKDVMAIDAPKKAEDAAVVPIEVFLFSRIGGNVKKLTVLIDRNPAPLVAKMTFGDAAGSSSRKIATRVRFNSYSFIRAVAEMDDGKLYMTSRFVIAAGGCSSGGVKDLETASNNVGQVRIKRFVEPGANPNQSSGSGEAQVMVRHPNFSGMQMDPENGEYIPAHYVNEIVVKRGKDIVFSAETGISLSSNPNLRFTYAPGAGEPLEVFATDSEGAKFKGILGKKVVNLQ